MFFRSFLAVVFACCFALGSEQAAVAISESIEVRHLPFGSILDPFLDERGAVTGYTRCGDSAIWTGHYLAAEAFRFRVTQDPRALRAVRTALRGIANLVAVTGGSALARCYIPADSPFAAGILREESEHPVWEGTCLLRRCYWIGGTSRDQYIGVFFGLSAAHEMIQDAEIRTEASDLATKLLSGLIGDDWAVWMPDGSTSTVFWHRPDQKLSLLLAGSKMNPARFSALYARTRLFEAFATGAPVLAEAADPHGSYFKFNLDALTFYQLARNEEHRTYRRFYLDAYRLFRRTVDDHGNAHFNMIDRAIEGPDPRRDAETRFLLDRWLLRPRRDERVDWRGLFRSCWHPERACDPIPVELRVRTDFLWQRSPFQLVGGGAGNIESAGIDYILPYWMARFYGIL